LVKRRGITKLTAIVLAVVIVGAIAAGIYLYLTIGPGAEKAKVAILFDVGGRGDLSFNDMAWLGAEKAAEEATIGAVQSGIYIKSAAEELGH